jgi:transposase
MSRGKKQKMPKTKPCQKATLARRQKGEVLKMNQIELIKDLQHKGMGPSEIAERLKLDRKTVSKYIKLEDYSPVQPIKKQYSSKLDQWKPLIDRWKEEDRKMRFKQRHTAKRIHDRLQEEYPNEYDCSYELVQRYCKQKKEQTGEKAGALELVWYPGEAQVDAGEADCYENGQLGTYKYLCISFPYSNSAYLQLFGGETAECISQGLQDIFMRIGGVASRLVFDNASGVGRRVGEKVRFAELFLRFKIHYGFEVVFCNPASGNEKGNVENKVGYLRRNLLVPIPSFTNIETFNRELLERSEADWTREHYKKLRPIAELFNEDQKALGSLPTKPFQACRYERLKTDGYGKFCLEGNHWYSSSPEMAGRELVVRISAHYVEPLDGQGEAMTRHRRRFGNIRTDEIDARTTMARLLKNPGAWHNSGIRTIVPTGLREHMDALDKTGLREVLRSMKELTWTYGFETAISAMDEAVKRDALNYSNSAVLAARIISSGLDVLPESGPDLSSYDKLLPERRVI